jgi:hypothetical protein
MGARAVAGAHLLVDRRTTDSTPAAREVGATELGIPALPAGCAAAGVDFN